MNDWDTPAIELAADDGRIYAHATAEGVLVHRSALLHETDPAFAPPWPKNLPEALTR